MSYLAPVVSRIGDFMTNIPTSFEEWNSEPIRLIVGDRVLFRFGSLPRDNRDIKQNPDMIMDEATRQGVLIEKGHRVVFATDYPHNPNYSSVDSTLSRRYVVPGFGSQVITMTATQFKKLPIIKIESQNTAEELHFCQFCQEVKSLKNTFSIQSFGRICCKHIIPFQENLSMPNVRERPVKEILNIYQNMYKNEDPISNIAGPCAYGITKALLHSKSWQKLPEVAWGEYFIDKVVGILTEEPFFEFIDAKGRIRRGSLIEIDQQLFPTNTGKTRAETYESWTSTLTRSLARETSSDKYLMPYRLHDDLKSHNISDDDIELLRSSHSRQEIYTMTTEHALRFLSTRKSGYSNESGSPRSLRQDALCLKKDVTVRLEYPCVKLSLESQFPCRTRYSEFTRLIAVSWPTLSSKAELILYIQNNMKQIVSSIESFPASARTRLCQFDNLESGDTIEVRSTMDNIGCRLPIEYLTAEFVSATLVGKYSDLGEVYECWRSARGDGNCYYRAVIFSVIESIITSGRLELFESIGKRFKSLITTQRFEVERMTLPPSDVAVVTLDGSVYLSVENVCEILRLASNGTIWSTVKEFEADVLDVTSGVDIALIRLCRQLVSNFLILNAETEFNGISLIDAILPSHDDCKDLSEYCEKYVNMMGEDAEGLLVNLGVLPLSLGFSAVTVVIDRREDVATNVYATASIEQTPTIHLLLRPGHYDSLYPRNPSVSYSADLLNGILNKTYKQSISMKEVKHPKNLQSKVGLVERSTTRKHDISAPGVSSVVGISSMKKKKLDNVMLELANQYRVIVSCNYLEILQHGGLWVDDSSSKSFYASAISLEDLFEQLSVDMAVIKQRIIRIMYGNGPKKIECLSLAEVPDNQALYPVIDRVITIIVSRQNLTTNSPKDMLVHIDMSLVTSLSFFKTLLFYQLQINRYATLYHSSKLLTNVELLQSGDSIHVVEIIPVSTILASHKELIFNISLEDSVREVISKFKLQLKIASSAALMIHIVDGQGKVILRVDESTNIDDFHNIISNKHKVHLSYCDVGMSSGCLGTSYDCFQVQDGCNHMLCYSCFERTVDLLPPRPLLKVRRDDDFGSTVVSTQMVHSIFAVPDAKLMESDRHFSAKPIMRKIYCPVPGCNFALSPNAIKHTAIYRVQLAAVENEIKLFDNELSRYRQCALWKGLCRDDQLYPVTDLVQLDCDHFFHADCIALHLKQEVEAFRGMLNTAKGRIDVKRHPFSCPVCDGKHVCWCLSCLGSRSHILLEKELKYIQTCDSAGTVTAEIMESFCYCSAVFAMRTQGNEDLVLCNAGGCHAPNVINRSDRVLLCHQCQASTCLQCLADAHPNKTCEAAARDRAVEGILMQMCPQCNDQGMIPEDCFHITCQQPGCRQQFCLLCAASYTPTIMHGNHYHRRQCDRFTDVCCDKNCVKNNAEYCVQDKYLPGPCPSCRANNRGNPCVHNNWNPCSTCKQKKLDCHHWCLECEKLGRLCSRPVENNRFRIISLAEATAEQERLAKK